MTAVRSKWANALALTLCGLGVVGSAFSQTAMCPDGTYVNRGPCQLCPDGKYIGASGHCTLAPDGSYVPGGYNHPPQLAPDGSYVPGGGTPRLCPDGTYVSGDQCVLTPDGHYVGR